MKTPTNNRAIEPETNRQNMGGFPDTHIIKDEPKKEESKEEAKKEGE